MNPQRPFRRERGQAVIELLIAMIALLVALAAILQISVTGHESIRNMAEARGDADSNAKNDVGAFTGGTIGTWEDGDDALRYTADDEGTAPVFYGLEDYEAELTGGFDVTSLDALGFYDELSPQLIPSSIGLSSVVYEGEASRTVEIEPALRSLLFMTVDEIQLNDKIYMPGFSVNQF